MKTPRLDHSTLPALDVLRGLAIIAVLVSHFWPGDFPAPQPLLIFGGQFGVILFFFLSGFLMDRTYADEPRLFPYFVRRSFRILPMYWLSILVVLVTESGWTLRDVAANALFITGPAHVARMNGVYWTLYIEVLFYALVPLIIFIGRRAILSGPCLVTTLFGGLWVLHVRAGVAPHYLAYCLTGLQFGAWQRDVISGKALALSFGIVVIATGILPIVAPFPDIVSPLLGLAPLVCGLLLWLALVAPFRSKPVAFFGNISYSLYLVHAVIGFRIANTMLSYGFAGWIAALAGVAVSILLSVVTLAVVERPMIGLGKRIIRQWRDLAA